MDIINIGDLANEMGIDLYQRYSAEKAANILNIDPATLAVLCENNEIAYLELPNKKIEFFGRHILEYLQVIIKSTSHDLSRDSTDSILRMPEVKRITGLSRTTIWRYEKDGRFPQRVMLGGGSIGWYSSEVLKWVASRKRQPIDY